MGMGQPLNKRDFKNFLAAASSNMEWALDAAKSFPLTGRMWPGLAKGRLRPQDRPPQRATSAASVPAASVATAMDLGYEEVVAQPVSRGSRQLVNVELPTAILRNLLETTLEFVHAVRAEKKQPAEDSPLNQIMTTAWGGLRDTDLVAALRARSFAYCALTTLMIFW